ncbi:MAG TPA: hypothetical protein VF275_09385 [Gammaproteobacteria bacterium]
MSSYQTDLSRKWAVLSVALLLTACANPLNRHTSQHYADTCFEAEDNGRMQLAEEACTRALRNVEMGNLGDALKSTRMYDLGRIKRQLGKFEEAADLQLESIRIAEVDPAFDDVARARRYAELAMSLAALDRWRDGADWLVKVVPVRSKFDGAEAAFLEEVFARYATRMKRLGAESLARKFSSAISSD